GHLLHEAATAAETAEHLTEGTRVGPYRIEGVLGRGGMGTVYRAARADGTFEKAVALKLVKRGMDTDEVLRRFRHERQILAGLDHPHIARLLDAGAADDGRPYLVMEVVDGLRITDYADRRGLDLGARLALFEQVCGAVAYAHRHLVVHRDLKPSNILVSESEDAGPPQVKLLDFGIARLLDSAPRVTLTQAGQRVLTPEYAAP
ncbi:MAG: serine/threonine-protein kinase, partial [Bacteroidota bacterium]